MRKLIALYIFFISVGLFAYKPSVEAAEIYAENIHANVSSPSLSVNSTYKEFERAAKKNGIPHRKINTLKSVKNGYYIVAGVFGSELNAKKSVKTFQKKGFNANYIKNTEKGLNYVYLEYHKNGENAIDACSSKFEGRYTKEIWVLVANNPKNTITKSQKKKSESAANKKIEKPKTNLLIKSSANFLALAKANKVATRTFSKLKGAKNGYYIVAGVYSNENSVKKLVKDYIKKGFESNYIKVSETGLNYIYLQYHENGKNAIDASASKLNGKYVKDTWVLAIKNSANTIVVSTKKPVVVTNPPIKKQQKQVRKLQKKDFTKLAKENNIPTRTFSNLKGVKNGYYIIQGVYSNEKSVKKLVEKYSKKGFESNYINITDTGLNYVYLQHHTEGQSAIEACMNKLNGDYKEKVWIIKVDESERTNHLENSILIDSANQSDLVEEVTAIGELTYDMLNNAKTEELSKILTFKNTSNKSQLIQRADRYFDKMWYAEAAILYEQALEKNKENFTFEIIQRTADSHYFNTDMEKAYYWYNILYEQFTDEMSADNIFKYAHSLKGTGKYARSKRLMRIYNKKIKNGDISKLTSRGATSNERVLDNILGAKQEYELKNMSINTIYSDFSPMFLDSNKVVFASARDSSFFNTRRYKWNNQPYLDLFVAKINKESQDLKDAIKFSKKINTKYHEASVTFSPDNTTMYFTRNNYGKKLKRSKKGVNHLKIYRSKKVNGEWSEAVEVPFNSDEFSTGHPALSPDGKKLYFVSDMPGSIGQTDIFVVDVLENNTYSEPRNLGPEVNTEKKEMFPFINDSKLYFSSNGHTGLGGLDIFESIYTEEDGFQTATNMGQPINSKKDDFSYIVNEENQKGFFASNRAKGKGDDDIYAFKRLTVEETPENKNAIAGVVTELITGDIMPESLVELLDDNGVKLKEMVTSDDGSFIFEDLDGDTKYTIRTTKGEFFDEEFETATKDNELVTIDVSLRKLKEMIAIEDGIRKLKTEMIYFDFDKSYIRRDASEELSKLVEVMTEYPNMVIKIESHTDSRGTRAYNKYLSDKRAKSTRDYIISKGIDPKRIQSAKGYGEEQLLNECNGSVRCSEKQHFLNRRSEFIIVNM